MGVDDLMENSIPSIPNKLVQALDDIFPDKCPRIEDSNRMVWFRAGQRSVVDFLIEHSNRQNETILDRQS